jgi:hypothetical protein
MHFIFGYQREIPAKIKTKAPLITLVGLAILIILLLILLSFENLAGEISPSPSAFDGGVFFETSGHQVNSFGDVISPFFDFSSLSR